MARTLDITSYTLEDRDTLSDQEAIHEYSRLRHDVVRRQRGGGHRIDPDPPRRRTGL